MYSLIATAKNGAIKVFQDDFSEDIALYIVSRERFVRSADPSFPRFVLTADESGVEDLDTGAVYALDQE